LIDSLIDKYYKHTVIIRATSKELNHTSLNLQLRKSSDNCDIFDDFDHDKE